MTVTAHKFLDVMYGRPGAEMELTLLPDARGDEARRKSLVDSITDIERSEKFDFGDIHLEPSQEQDGEYRLPRLTSDENEAWQEGLLPLPFPVCWFEFNLGNSRSSLLITEVDTLWLVRRFDWIRRGKLIIDGIYMCLNREEPEHFTAWGNTSAYNQLNRDSQLHSYVSNGLVSLYLTLMINSRSTEIKTEAAPERLNLQRIKAGKTPLPEHRVVRIIPEKYLREQRAEAGLERLPPRLHWRRSHIRTLNRDTETEKRVLIPRCLVGRGEAELSHEYRVYGPQSRGNT